MACSFRYFLLKRCQGLTGLNTTSTKKFFAAAEDAHPEAFAPLLLLAICDGREEYLLRRAEGTKAAEMFDGFVEHWHASGRPLEVYLGMLSDGDPFKTILRFFRYKPTRIAKFAFRCGICYTKGNHPAERPPLRHSSTKEDLKR